MWQPCGCHKWEMSSQRRLASCGGGGSWRRSLPLAKSQQGRAVEVWGERPVRSFSRRDREAAGEGKAVPLPGPLPAGSGALPRPGSRVLSLEALARHNKDQVVLSTAALTAPGRSPDNSGGFCPLPRKPPSLTRFLLRIPPGLTTLAVLLGESPSEIGVLGQFHVRLGVGGPGACSWETRSERGPWGYLDAVASPLVVLPHTRFENVG